MSAGAGPAPGVVKVRLLGAAEDIEAAARVLCAGPRLELVDRSPLYPNRRDPGARAYLTLQITQPAGGAAR